MAERDWAERDYYAELGVSSSAPQEEIKKAYRKIARENHPDKRPGDKAAEEKFKRAAEAYDVVGDEKTRKEYDDFRAMLRSGGFGGPGFAGGFRRATRTGAPGGFSASDIFGSAGFGGDGGVGDIFGSVFGRGDSRRAGARPTRGADIETDITLDFREAARGTTIPIQISGNAPCTTCHGSGSRSGKSSSCSACHGSGFMSENRGSFGFSSPCTECGGTGEKIDDPCATCSGLGTVSRARSITVRIPAGVQEGQRVRLAGQGEAGPNGRPSGDLFVTVHVRHDDVFRRSGDDLQVEVPVSFAELVLGGTVTVPTLDDPVRVKVPSGTTDGQTLRVRGRGVKNGDLLVTLRVRVPKHLNDAARSALRAYAQAERDSGFNPRSGWKGAV